MSPLTERLVQTVEIQYSQLSPLMVVVVAVHGTILQAEPVDLEAAAVKMVVLEALEIRQAPLRRKATTAAPVREVRVAAQVAVVVRVKQDLMAHQVNLAATAETACHLPYRAVQ
jgi:hypothetical protein